MTENKAYLLGVLAKIDLDSGEGGFGVRIDENHHIVEMDHSIAFAGARLQTEFILIAGTAAARSDANAEDVLISGLGNHPPERCYGILRQLEDSRLPFVCPLGLTHSRIYL